jgi:hypothetical protein
MVDRCWHRFEEDYAPEERTTAAAMGDNSWYTDSGATDHITSDLEKLAIHDKYNGNDQIHTTRGSSMNIRHIGHNTIHNPCQQLQLSNILHVPQAFFLFPFIHLLLITMFFSNFTLVSFVSTI